VSNSTHISQNKTNYAAHKKRTRAHRFITEWSYGLLVRLLARQAKGKIVANMT